MTQEFSYTIADFEKISAILAAEAGVVLTQAKAPLVYSRLAKRLRALGMESFRDYCALIETEEHGDERQIVIASLTTHVTSFFREPHHFAHLKRTVLPPLIDRARRGGKVRLWSAGCSSGEEPYSLALTVLEVAEDAPALDIKILATDIDPRVLATAREGVYAQSAAASIHPDIRRRWLAPHRAGEGDSFRIAEAPRALVRFNALNLFAQWPMKNPFDVILCRNVAIYFEVSARAQLWRRMALALSPGGYLYVGHSERILDARDIYELEGVTTYRRVQEMN